MAGVGWTEEIVEGGLEADQEEAAATAGCGTWAAGVTALVPIAGDGYPALPETGTATAVVTHATCPDRS